MRLDKNKVKRILVITLSNVGDVILTTPVVETLIVEFPSSRIDVMVGPNSQEVFRKHQGISKLMIYDKHIPPSRKIALIFKLRRLRYDLVVDLRNTVFPYLLQPRYRTKGLRDSCPTFQMGTLFFRFIKFKKSVPAKMHKRDIHLSRLKDLGFDVKNAPFYLPVDKEDEDHVNKLLIGVNRDKLVLISPGAKSHTKRWPVEYFTRLCDVLHERLNVTCALIGDENDRNIADEILAKVRIRPLDFVEKTNLTELAGLMKRAKLLITNDSAPMHVASAVNTPCIAIFGPTDEAKYGPCSEETIILRNRRVKCAPCEQSQCRYDYECMKGISVDDAVEAVKRMLA